MTSTKTMTNQAETQAQHSASAAGASSLVKLRPGASCLAIRAWVEVQANNATVQKPAFVQDTFYMRLCIVFVARPAQTACKVAVQIHVAAYVTTLLCS